MNSFPPMNSVMLEASLRLFSQVSVIMMGFVSVVLIMRISLLVTTLGSAQAYGELIKDVVSYLGIVSLFPMLVKLIISSTTRIADSISVIPNESAQAHIQSFFQKIAAESIAFRIFGSIGDLIVTGLASSVYTVLIGLLLSIAPIILFLSLMLGMSHGVKTYLGTFIAFCLWPVLWNLLGRLGSSLTIGLESAPLKSVLFALVIQGLQLISPLLCVFLFKNLSTGGVITKTVVKLGLPL